MTFASHPVAPITPMGDSRPARREYDPDEYESVPLDDDTEIFPEIRTKVVGTTFSPVGQKALAIMKQAGPAAFTGASPRYKLVIREDWENEHDGDALAVYLRATELGEEIKLGFIGNKERICRDCRKVFPPAVRASDSVLVCPDCAGETRRNGVATRISRFLRSAGIPAEEFLRAEIAWDHGGITGGATAAIRFGCNIRISAT